MMAYDSGFVLSIIHNGHPVREQRGDDGRRTCTIPFNSEYKIRLKNNHSVRASARVYIDGTPVFGAEHLLMDPKSGIDLERFVTELQKGRRFKFVPLAHADVQDPTSGENGVIRVAFHKEKRRPWMVHEIVSRGVVNTREYHPQCRSVAGHQVTECFSKSMNSTPIGDCIPPTATFACNAAPNGATVEGSLSRQEFRQSSEHIDFEDEEIVLEIQLRGAGRESLWRVSGAQVFYRGERLEGVHSVATSSAGDITIQLRKNSVDAY